MATNPYRRGTKGYLICEFAISGLTRTDAYRELSPKVKTQTRPWIYTANVGGGRTAKSMRDQLTALRYDINRKFAEMGRHSKDSFGDDFKDDYDASADTANADSASADVDVSDDILDDAISSADDDSDDSDDDTSDDLDDDDDTDDNRPVKRPTKYRSELEFFVQEWRRLRAWIAERAERTGTPPIDDLAMRPLLAAKVAIREGIPARALLFSMTMHWPDEVRRDAGIETFNFESESEPIAAPNGKRYHKLAAYVLKLARARVPIMLIGPAGTGKSRLLRDVAELLGNEMGMDFPYGETPMTAGATPSWLVGSYTLEGFRTRPFLEIYSAGGLFNFEEIDAADPNLLLVTNNALAADSFFNPANGEMYSKSGNFVAACTANTFGLGANRAYTGRERLDAATIDRWRMGRVLVQLDEELAEYLALEGTR